VAFFTIPIMHNFNVQQKALYTIGLFSVIGCLILFFVLSGKYLPSEKSVNKSESNIKKLGLFGFLSNRCILTLSAFIIISSVALRFINYSFFNVSTVQFKSDSLELLTSLSLFEALKLFSASYSPHL
jgi:Na+/melibiose symporter-like transporter